METAAKKTRGPKKNKTAADYEKELQEAEQLVQKLRLKIAEDKIGEKISKSGVVTEFKKLQAELDGSVSDIDLLAAVGKALGIVRLHVTQAPLKTRAKKGTATAQGEEKKP